MDKLYDIQLYCKYCYEGYDGEKDIVLPTCRLYVPEHQSWGDCPNEKCKLIALLKEQYQKGYDDGYRMTFVDRNEEYTNEGWEDEN